MAVLLFNPFNSNKTMWKSINLSSHHTSKKFRECFLVPVQNHSNNIETLSQNVPMPKLDSARIIKHQKSIMSGMYLIGQTEEQSILQSSWWNETNKLSLQLSYHRPNLLSLIK